MDLSRAKSIDCFARCQMCLLHSSSVSIPRPPVQLDNRTLQLFTGEGFLKCMLASRIFGMPFVPSCPRINQALLVQVVLSSKDLFLVDAACFESLTPSYLLMAILRLLTWIRRERDVLAIVAMQDEESIQSAQVPASLKVLKARLDVESWVVLLYWIAECCGPHLFLFVLFSVPAEYLFAVCRTLTIMFNLNIEGEREDHYDQMVHTTSLNKYLEYAHWNERRQHFRFSRQHSSKTVGFIDSFEYEGSHSSMFGLSVVCSAVGMMVMHQDMHEPLLARRFFFKTTKKVLAYLNVQQDRPLRVALAKCLLKLRKCKYYAKTVQQIVQLDYVRRNTTMMQTIWGISYIDCRDLHADDEEGIIIRRAAIETARSLVGPARERQPAADFGPESLQ
jgi:hypothetical protein